MKDMEDGDVEHVHPIGQVYKVYISVSQYENTNVYGSVNGTVYIVISTNVKGNILKALQRSTQQE